MLRPREDERSQRGDGVRAGVDREEGYHWLPQLGTCRGQAERESREPCEWQVVPGGWGWGVSVE